jgi:hypothetical protein
MAFWKNKRYILKVIIKRTVVIMERKELSALGESIYEYREADTRRLHAAGEVLSEGENPVKLLATGLTVNTFDQYISQDSKSIKSMLGAIKDVGFDLNAPIDGEPAAFFLTEHYTKRHASNELDTSMAAEYGLTDSKHLDYLATYANSGVDFSQRNSKGQNFVSHGQEVLKDFVQTSKPRVMEPGYTADYPGATAPFKSISEDYNSSMNDIKKESVKSIIASASSDAVAKEPVVKTAVKVYSKTDQAR